MKRIIFFLGLLAFSAMSYTVPYFPVSHTPESLQLLHGGFNNEGRFSTGVELGVHGEKDKSLVERLLGDWTHFNHAISIGYLLDNFDTSILYGSVKVYLTAWDAIGTGVKQIVYYSNGLPKGSNLRGETNFVVYYQLPNKSILWNDDNEYLNFYLGFKSDHSDFYKDDIEDIVANAVDLYKVAQNMTFGIYYNPDVLDGTVSMAVELNTLGRYNLLLYLNI